MDKHTNITVIRPYPPTKSEFEMMCKEESRLRVFCSHWKSKFIQQNKDLGCEQMDPNGTIWDHAKKLQAENERLREAVNKLTMELERERDNDVPDQFR